MMRCMTLGGEEHNRKCSAALLPKSQQVSGTQLCQRQQALAISREGCCHCLQQTIALDGQGFCCGHRWSRAVPCTLALQPGGRQQATQLRRRQPRRFQCIGIRGTLFQSQAQHLHTSADYSSMLADRSHVQLLAG